MPGARTTVARTSGSPRACPSYPCRPSECSSSWSSKNREVQALTTRQRSGRPATRSTTGRSCPLTSTRSPSRPAMTCCWLTCATRPSLVNVVSLTTRTRSLGAGGRPAGATTIAPKSPPNTCSRHEPVVVGVVPEGPGRVVERDGVLVLGAAARLHHAEDVVAAALWRHVQAVGVQIGGLAQVVHQADAEHVPRCHPQRGPGAGAVVAECLGASPGQGRTDAGREGDLEHAVGADQLRWFVEDLARHRNRRIPFCRCRAETRRDQGLPRAHSSDDRGQRSESRDLHHPATGNLRSHRGRAARRASPVR